MNHLGIRVMLWWKAFIVCWYAFGFVISWNSDIVLVGCPRYIICVSTPCVVLGTEYCL